MAQALMQLYEAMSESAQQELYDFALFLVSKNEIQNSEAEKQKKLSSLYEFAGSGKKLWAGVDALKYQNALREERTIG